MSFARSGVELVASADLLSGALSGVAPIGRICVQYPATAVMLMAARGGESAESDVPRPLRPFTSAALIERVEELISEQRRIDGALVTAFEWNRAAKEQLASVRESLRENIRQSRQQRAERFCSHLREAGAAIPTILVAEDNPSMRYAVCRFLKARGFRVLEASDGAGALRLSRSYCGRIDLVVTDFAMPGRDGLEVVNALTSERPVIDVILMTGDEAGFPYCTLRKPFELDDLLAAVVGTLRRA